MIKKILAFSVWIAVALQIVMRGSIVWLAIGVIAGCLTMWAITDEINKLMKQKEK